MKAIIHIDGRAVITETDAETAKQIHEENVRFRKMIRDAERERDFDTLFALLSGWQRFDAFKRLNNDMTDQQYWHHLGDIWVMAKFGGHPHTRTWLKWFTSPRPGRHHLMDAGERDTLRHLPKSLTVCRGFSCRKAVHGLSWTRDRAIAEWFARRNPDRRGYMATTTIKKAEIIAVFLGRSESEIVLDPRKLHGVTVEEVAALAEGGAK